MKKIFFLLLLSNFISSCQHINLEEQTVNALQGKWEVYEAHFLDGQTNTITVETKPQDLSMRLLSPWYGGDKGLYFTNKTEVIGKFNFEKDWSSFLKADYKVTYPNKLIFDLTWADNHRINTEILKLDDKELWVKQSFPNMTNQVELRLKKKE